MSPFDEIFILIIVAIFFSVIYEIQRLESIWSGIIASMFWLISGIVWLIRSSTVTVSLIFSALFMFYTARYIIDLADIRRISNTLGEGLED